MGLISMTGFGRGTARAEGLLAEVDLSSVNRKQLDVHMALPRGLAVLEARLLRMIRDAIRRGCVNGVVRVQTSGQTRVGRPTVNQKLAERYVRELRLATKTLKVRDDLGIRALTLLPDVLMYQRAEEDAEGVWPAVEGALRKALRGLAKTKRREGATLEKDVTRRFRRLEKILAELQKLSPAVAVRYREVLRQRLEAAGVTAGMEDPVLAREVAAFADRCDISEEIVRLGSHLQQGLHLVRSTEPAGRPLDFLCQEIFREINTIGSKANDLGISRCVIRFKTDLERIREQVQNVE